MRPFYYGFGTKLHRVCGDSILDSRTIWHYPKEERRTQANCRALRLMLSLY